MVAPRHLCSGVGRQKEALRRVKSSWGKKMDRSEPQQRDDCDEIVEIALVGDLTDNEAELTDRLLSVPPGGECVLFIDSPGGSPYCAIALTTLIRLRGINATGIVTGECSSATLWPFAACKRRIVTPYSVMLFHPMKWQSEEHVGLQEAAEWARHFGALEKRHGSFACRDAGRQRGSAWRLDQSWPLCFRPWILRSWYGRNGYARQRRNGTAAWFESKCERQLEWEWVGKRAQAFDKHRSDRAGSSRDVTAFHSAELVTFYCEDFSTRAEWANSRIIQCSPFPGVWRVSDVEIDCKNDHRANEAFSFLIHIRCVVL